MTSRFHGSFLEEDLHTLALPMFRFRFHPSGMEEMCESGVVLSAGKHQYIGLDGQERNIDLLWKRTWKMCGGCGEWFLAECAGDEVVHLEITRPQRQSVPPPPPTEGNNSTSAGSHNDEHPRLAAAGSPGVTMTNSTSAGSPHDEQARLAAAGSSGVTMTSTESEGRATDDEAESGEVVELEF